MIRKFFYEVIKSIFGPTVVPDTIYVSCNNMSILNGQYHYETLEQKI